MDPRGTIAKRRKYGRFLPHQRANVDQVPLPFVNDMEDTLELKGADRVTINQNGPALGKRQATGQVCFRPEVPELPEGGDKVAYEKFLMEQPPLCLIFRGTCGRITQAEKDTYPEGLVVLWQSKAWVDRPTAMAWVEKCWKPFIEAERAAGVAGSTDEYLLFQDNLDSQIQPEYIGELKKHATFNHQVPPNKTDQVQPVDRGLGRQIKIYMGQEMDKWLETEDNLEKWENNTMSASDRRICLANWYFNAWKKACNGTAMRRYFEKSGALLTADGSDDHLIKLEGVPKGEKFTF